MRGQHTPEPWGSGGVCFPDSPRPYTTIYGPREKPDDQSGPVVAEHVSLENAPIIMAAPIMLRALEAEEAIESHVAVCDECSLEITCEEAERLINKAFSLRRRALLLAGGEYEAADSFCRVCGCDDFHACPEGCYWVEPGLCSSCVGEEGEAS